MKTIIGCDAGRYWGLLWVLLFEICSSFDGIQRSQLAEMKVAGFGGKGGVQISTARSKTEQQFAEVTGSKAPIGKLARRCVALAQPEDCLEPHRALLLDYKAFHNANKHHPDAQYLVQTCWGHGCQGTGDRIRGTMFLLRLAIAHKKILLVDWTHPAPLTNFLLPNDIDWTLSGFEPGYFVGHNTLSEADFGAAVYEGRPDAVEKFHATKMHVVTTNQHFYINTMAGVTPVDYIQKLDIGSCYYNFLFKLNSTIVERGELSLRQLYGPSPVDYLAWHWRHFDADWPDEKPVMISHLRATMDCAQKLASEVGVDLEQRRLLLVTDFNIFREFVLEGHLKKVVTLNITAHHIDHQESSSEIFNGIFVDLYIMSHARCMLTSRSGFSKLALWMASDKLRKCHRDMQEDTSNSEPVRDSAAGASSKPCELAAATPKLLTAKGTAAEPWSAHHTSVAGG
ncbi:hypothetical protein VOLCADRAFT_107083 [Volvox carteri f. nagariensis]|uniref:Fucosyltransferase n=1 Tax=Volvox carteri f. nagariensis TaxID=3068 RepID=D8UBV6_VOLCA|nr:uncharacterized protein VOLCADRAFT_107083 [Volvox carteri f. nagariensis]EFJ42838.1 hypothetical protein VOLCADRAFT_107083 [Volvox carteri f. nagariensis]|eukprot:XP_002956098.1 hypothetical protein VOLCADRAFT_107083 [Volvox carteri f. nagariensis]